MNSRLISIIVIVVGIGLIIFRKQFSLLQIRKQMMFNKINPFKIFHLSNRLLPSDLEKMGMTYYTKISIIVGSFFILMGVLGLFKVVKFMRY
jgi:hypothetical protein